MDKPLNDGAEAHQGRSVRGWSLGAVVFVCILVVLLASLVLPVFNVITPHTNQMKATSHCRQIIMAMKAYAADHGGKYPTGRTANEVFRELIREDILQDERVFGCTLSRYLPDNDLGLAPGYDKAVGRGENHWMVVDGLRDDSPAINPVVFENALEATWPPFWDGSPYTDDVRKRGQTWKGAKIVIGLNDNSVTVEKLGGENVRRQTFQTGPDGRSIADWVPNVVVLDIEE